MDVKHPEVMVELLGHDGYPYSVIGRTQRAMRAAGLNEAEIDAYTAEALAGNDFNHILVTTMCWVEVA